MQLKRFVFALLFLPAMGFCDSLTLSGSGTGSLVINAPTAATPTSIYPATGTASFPYGLSASTVTVSSNTILPGATFYQGSYALYSSSIVFSPSTIGVFGTRTNDSALGGYVGQYVEGTGTAVNLTNATNTDIASIVLTPGDWDVSGLLEVMRAGATYTALDIYTAVSPTSGNSFTSETNGLNAIEFTPGAIDLSFTQIGVSVPTYRVSISATATWYLKGYTATVTAGTPTATGRISARRVR